jgi:high-affinity nickel-transport protein
MSIAYLFFSLLLGMRHGIDPDHLSIINGINLNSHANGNSSKWSGFFFSLGHGVTVTVIGVLLIFLKNASQTYSNVVKYTEWIPILLLLFTGFNSIFTLLKKSKKETHYHSRNKIIDYLTNTKYTSIKLFLTGLFFALIFDTSTQVAAWSLIGEANSQNLYLTAILVGLCFTFGMMVTDTLNGLLFYRILNENNTKFNFKLILSLLVIFSSLTIGCIQLLEKIELTIEIKDDFKLIWGVFIMFAIVFSVIINWIFTKKTIAKK